MVERVRTRGGIRRSFGWDVLVREAAGRAQVAEHRVELDEVRPVKVELVRVLGLVSQLGRHGAVGRILNLGEGEEAMDASVLRQSLRADGPHRGVIESPRVGWRYV